MIAADPSAFAGPTADKAGQPYPWWQSRRYWLATFFFLCALLSKSLTASLPAALLVIVWWQRGRIERSTWVPLVPWFLLGLSAGAFTGWVEHAYIGAKGDDFSLGLIERGLLAGRVVWFYLGKYLWPADLIFIYPRWEIDASVWWQWLFPLATVGLLAALWQIRGRARGPLAGCLVFGGSLVPTLGFFNVYAFKYSYVADHWNYLPSLALAVMAAWGAVWAGDRWFGRRACAGAGPDFKPGPPQAATLHPSHRPAGVIAITVVLIVLGILSWRQCGLYRDIESFYELTLRRNPGAWMAHQNLGVIRVEQGRIDEGIAHFQKELELRPSEAEAENNLGTALARKGQAAEALARFERAVKLKPDYPEAWLNLGMSLADAGRTEEASAALRETIRLQPMAVEAHVELGALASAAGRHGEALGHFEEAARLRPHAAAAQINVAQALAAAGRTGEAIARLESALVSAPGAELHNALGVLLAGAQRPADAQRQFEQAVARDPNSGGAYFNLGILHAQGGRLEEAVRAFERAAQLDPRNPVAFQALAQAYAETGRTREAQDAMARALELSGRRPVP